MKAVLLFVSFALLATFITGQRLCFGLAGDQSIPSYAIPVPLSKLQVDNDFSQQFFTQYNVYGLPTWNVTNVPNNCVLTMGRGQCVVASSYYFIYPYLNGASACGNWNLSGMIFGYSYYQYSFPTLSVSSLYYWSNSICPDSSANNHITLVYDTRCSSSPTSSPSPSPTYQPGSYECCYYYSINEKFATSVCLLPGSECPGIQDFQYVGNETVKACSYCQASGNSLLSNL